MIKKIRSYFLTGLVVSAPVAITLAVGWWFINKIDAKIHYPTSMHLQPAAKKYGYKKGDFPIAEKLSKTSISLPVHEFVKEKDLKFMSNIILRNLIS